MKFIWLCFILISSTCYASPNPLGVWQTNCNSFTKHSYKATLSLSESKIISITRFFSDPACSRNSITITYDGMYSVGEPFGEGTEINQIPSSIKFTIHLQEVVEQYNKVAIDGCGVTDWKVDIPQEVSGRYCRPLQLPANGQMIYDIFSVKGNSLQFGGLPLSMEMSKSSLRPQTLLGVVFRRIDL